MGLICYTLLVSVAAILCLTVLICQYSYVNVACSLKEKKRGWIFDKRDGSWMLQEQQREVQSTYQSMDKKRLVLYSLTLPTLLLQVLDC